MAALQISQNTPLGGRKVGAIRLPKSASFWQVIAGSANDTRRQPPGVTCPVPPI